MGEQAPPSEQYLCCAMMGMAAVGGQGVIVESRSGVPSLLDLRLPTLTLSGECTRTTGPSCLSPGGGLAEFYGSHSALDWFKKHSTDASGALAEKGELLGWMLEAIGAGAD